MITQVAVSPTPDCPLLFEPVSHDFTTLQDHSLNPTRGWLPFSFISQQAYLCVSHDPSFGEPLTDLLLTKDGSNEASDANGEIVAGNQNLNAKPFGTPIYLRTMDTTTQQPISNLRLVTQPPKPNQMPLLRDGLGGNLNQGGFFFGLFTGNPIYLEIFRDTNSPWVDDNSLPVLVSYEFQEAGIPEPGYQVSNFCLLWIFCINPPLFPCYHIADLVSFADETSVYTFYTMSDDQYAQAYLVRTPYLESTGTVADEGSVVYYEEIREFNHPSKHAVHGRIVLSAVQNYDYTPPWPDIRGIGCDLVNCGCEADIPPENQDRKRGYIIWDFTKNLTSPDRFVLDNSAFDVIKAEVNPTAGVGISGFWGGTVDGELVVRISNRWFTVTDYDNLRDIENSWQEITTMDFPVNCEGELNGAGQDFVELNGASYYAAFDFECYTLRPATFDGAALVVGACSTLVKKCPPQNSLLEAPLDFQRIYLYQTATESPDGRMYVTSVSNDGRYTQTMSSDI